MMRAMRGTLFTLILAAGLVGGCKKSSTGGAVAPTGGSGEMAGSGSAAEAPAAGKHATATLAPTAGNNVQGTVELTETAAGLEIKAHLTGLTPGDHGFHIHAKGDCSAPDGTSAGGHFNPGNHQHGAPDAADHHEGDLGNITAGADGTADKTMTVTDINLGDGANSVVDKAFIVHAKADDLKTQPTGDAGARVACGVIKLGS